MRDILVPIFGEDGAIIVQYAITLAVVVALIALVVWGLRHYGGGAVRPAVRGRLPRLAIIDTLPVDTKRKLVLLRRDNVEHLVLIGGPSDVVVESSIVRQRVAQRPGQATATATRSAVAATVTAAPPAAEEPYEATREELPIVRPAPVELEAPPSPDPLTAYQARRGNGASERATSERPASERPASERATRPFVPSRRETVRPAPASAAESARGSQRVLPVAAEASEHEAVELHEASARARPSRHERVGSRFVPAPAPIEPDEPPHGPVPGYESIAEEHDATASAFAPRPYDEEQGAGPESDDPERETMAMEVGSAPPTADAEPPEGTEPPENASELEIEMARLLGQISTARQERS